MKFLKRQSEFTRSVVTLMTGTTIAQAIPVAISPVLTRIYGPEDFGVLAIFVALTAIFGSIANARYEFALMLPETDEDALNVAATGLLVAVLLSLVLLIAVLLFRRDIAALLGNGEIGNWLLLVPVSVLLTGIFNVQNYYRVRNKDYRIVAAANVHKSLATAALQLGLGAVKAGAAGLVAGHVAGLAAVNISLARALRRGMLAPVSKARIRQVAARYKDFPKFSIWTALANTGTTYLTQILISAFYTVSTLGFYLLVERVLTVPSTLIGSSVGQVFFQQATAEKQKTGKAVEAFNSTSIRLAAVSLPGFTILYFIAEELFAFVFGEEWRIAGKYAAILCPWFAVRFVAASLSIATNVFEKQKIFMWWQIVSLVIALTSFNASMMLGIEFIDFLHVLSYAMAAHYLILFFLLKRIAFGKI